MPEYTRTGQPNNALTVFNRFVETSHAVLKYADSALEKSSNLSASRFIVLVILENNGGTMTSAKLAGETETKPHNITKIIDGMKRDGFVTTKKNDADRRFVYITLTDKGRAILEKGKPAALEVVGKTMASIGSKDLVVLEKILTTLKKNVTGEAG